MVLDSSPPRLTISKLALINFKSYAGRQEIGPFHKSFSAIVGPNGSGKSNVIDALLFVFGFKAKKMRQGKLCELIHNSKEYPNLESCSVEVHFEDVIDLPNNDFEILPNTQLVVSRTAFVNNKSQYFINDQVSSFTEVTSLLKGRGIDLDHKRFLILQGEVESISLMKPKAANDNDEGLLEYLEDIIGTSAYKKSIEEAEKNLDILVEEKDIRLNRLKIVQGERDALKDKNKEAEDFLKLENDLIRSQSLLFQVVHSETLESINEIEKAGKVIEETLNRERSVNASQVAEIKELETAFNSETKEYELISKRAEEISKELGKFDREDIQLQEKRKHLKNKIKKLNKSISSDKSEISTKTFNVENLEKEMTSCQSELETLEASLAKEEVVLEQVVDSLRGKTEGFQAELEKKQEELFPWTEKISEKESNIKVLNSELELLRKKMNSAESSLKQVTQQRSELTQSLKEKEANLKSVQAEYDQINQLFQEVTDRMETLDKSEQILKSEYMSLRQKAEEAKSSLQQSNSSNNVLSSLMKEKSSKRIKGIHGRLGDLGVIDDKYDVAISTSCSRLDNIVVDNTTVAQTCIEFLKKNNLGRATFIALDKMKEDRKLSANLPAGVHRLFDLIDIKDSAYKSAFYFALGDTLVCDTLELAKKLAYGSVRYRVVTIDGKLIDTSGTMSGGGQRVARGGMKSSFAMEVKPEEVQALEKQRDKKLAELKAIESEKETYQAQIGGLKSLLREKESCLKKSKLDISSIQSRLDDLAGRDQELKKRKDQKPSEHEISRVKELETEIKANNKELEKLKASSLSIEDSIHSLQESIMKVGGVRLKSQKAKVDGLKEQIETIQSRISKIKVEKSSLGNALKRSSGGQEKLLKEIAELEEALATLEAEMKSKLEVAVEVRKRCDEALILAETKKEQLEAAKENLESRAKVVNKFRTMEVELKAKLEDKFKSLEDLRSKAASLLNKIKNLRLNELESENKEDRQLHMLTEEEMQSITAKDVNRLEKEINQLQSEISGMKQPNLSVLQEFKDKNGEYQRLVQEMDEFQVRYNECKFSLDDLRKKRFEEFMAGFTTISQKLKEMYQMITMGGNAELELVDSLDPFSEGIIFSVMPPKKSWKNIANLSGGEKTLSSLALVFALHHYKPTPLYFMDEIDAALDFRNVSIVANYIKERTKNAQFIIISLRNNMFELADRLVGIYKTHQCTKSITINPNQIQIPVLKVNQD